MVGIIQQEAQWDIPSGVSISICGNTHAYRVEIYNLEEEMNCFLIDWTKGEKMKER